MRLIDSDYEDLILAYQDTDSEYDDCIECEYASVEKCKNQCCENTQN